MPIHPLPQFEADVQELQDERDREIYEKLKPPDTIVVRFGSMKMIGEFKYFGESKPGCGSRIVVTTFRGTEVGEMLTSTCPNAGCSKSVTRKEMLDYIENSGGRKYPFTRNGRALRVATKEDMDAQAKVEQSKHELKMDARRRAEAIGLDAKVVEVEPLLGGEQITVYYVSEASPDMGPLQKDLAQAHGTTIEVKQIGARDEARLTADYERCGQYCCCKNFLKVLKPVSMRSAKTQKATLDPLKISGRCGRLMCCLRYEDETYESLRKRLPNRKKHVGTPEGDGVVIDTQILTQLVLVKLDGTGGQVAVPVEEITEPGEQPHPDAGGAERREAGQARGSGDRGGAGQGRGDRKGSQRDRSGDADTEQPGGSGTETEPSGTGASPAKKKRRRRRRKPSSGQQADQGQGGDQPPTTDTPEGGDDVSGSDQPGGGGSGPPQQSTETEQGDTGASSGSGSSGKKRRRRRRRRGGGGSQGSSSSDPGGSGDSGGRPDGGGGPSGGDSA